jgi:hypothetical protein
MAMPADADSGEDQLRERNHRTIGGYPSAYGYSPS